MAKNKEFFLHEKKKLFAKQGKKYVMNTRIRFLALTIFFMDFQCDDEKNHSIIIVQITSII